MLKNGYLLCLLIVLFFSGLSAQNSQFRLSVENAHAGLGVHIKSDEGLEYFNIPAPQRFQIGLAAIKQLGKYSAELQVNIPQHTDFDKRKVSHFIVDDDILFGYGRSIQMSSYFSLSRILEFGKHEILLGLGVSPNYRYAHFEPVRSDKFPLIIKAYSLNSYTRIAYHYELFNKLNLNVYSVLYLAESRRLIYDQANPNLKLGERVERMGEYRVFNTIPRLGIGLSYVL